jgi:hypothetical protein
MMAGAVASSQRDSTDANASTSTSRQDDGSSSLLGVLASVVVVAVSMALLGLLAPMSAITVIMAAVAGIWLLSSSSADKPVQMSPLPASAEAAASNGHTQPGASGPGAEDQVCMTDLIAFRSPIDCFCDKSDIGWHL